MALQSSRHENTINIKKLFNVDELEDTSIKLKSGKYTGFISKLKDAQDVFVSAKIDNCDLVLETYNNSYITLLDYFTSNGKNSFKYVAGADYYGSGGYTYVDLINDGNIANNNIFNKYTLEHDFNIKTSSKITATAFNDVIDLSKYTKDDLKEDKNKNLQGFNINAGSGNDIITGSVGNDTISAGLGSYNEIHFDATKKIGDDIINLVKGEKTKLIFEGDVSGQLKLETKGKDGIITVYGQKATSSIDPTLVVDTSKTLGTITIKNIAQKNVLGNNGELTISSDYEFSNETDLLKEAYYNVTPNNKGKVVGTYLNNSAQSTTGIEKFNLGTGSDEITFEGEFNDDVITLNKSEKLRLNFNDVTNSNQLKFTAEGKNVKISAYDSNNNIKGSVTLNNFASKDVLGNNGKIYATYNDGGTVRNLKNVLYEVFANKKNTFNGTYLNNFAKSSSKNETFNLGTGNNKIDIDLTQEGGFGTDSIVLKKDSGLDINFIGLSSEEQIEAVKKGNDVVLTVYDEMGDNELGKVKLLNFVKNPTDVDIDGDDSFLFDTFYMDVDIKATSAKTYGTIANDTIFSQRSRNTFVEKYNSWGYCGDNVITSRKDALDTIQISALDKSIEKLSAADMDFLYYKDEDSTKKTLEISISRTGRAITYKQADDNGDTDVNLSNVKFIDAEGTKYSFFEATSDTNLAKTCGKTNNIVFSSIDDNADKGLTFTDSKNSDFIYGSDKDDRFIYQNGGFDIFNGGYGLSEEGGNGSDTYTVNTFNKKSQLMIMDYDDGEVESSDTLIFANNNVRDLRLFFDVNKDGKVGEGWNLSIINKDVMADSKGIIKKFSNYVIPGSVEIHRYFSSRYPTTEHGEGYIENIFTKDYVETENGLDMDSWTAKIASEVANWLDNHQNYETSFDVFRAGNKVDVESLLNVYNAVDYQSAISSSQGI